eukprot:CAMPEP_0172624986 /NCGR_PEP_ID=MMETSP1068-20121228/140631_1 /TAXON_ID=35684 /ORGANISM="Pseudopedinella elastica, Strain CCMP716" /LENGTH=74 /DNA_ID=CAMNT_0013434139 /DNA_START=41 /DNA_END=261 /DNA_ORIENTATION=-
MKQALRNDACDFGTTLPRSASMFMNSIIDKHKAARKLDAKLGTPTAAVGPAEAEMDTCNSEHVPGLAVGAIGEV